MNACSVYLEYSLASQIDYAEASSLSTLCIQATFLFGYKFSSIYVVKSTRNQMTGYELTFSFRLWLDFSGTSWP